MGSKVERGGNTTTVLLIVSSLRDVLEMKVSPTAVFHFVTNSSSGIALQAPVRNKVRVKRRENKTLETNLVLTQNTQADSTHHLYNVHLPPLVRIADLSKPTHHLQCHLASDLVFELKGPGQF